MLHTVRRSNFELLRIVAMMFIVAHHFLIATGSISYRDNTLHGGELANSFFVVGVNCFILISGYFGIKLRARKFARLLYCIFFVAVVDFLLGLTGLQLFDSDYALHTIVPFHEGCNWFMPTYFALMLLSPVLNKAINTMSEEELLTTVVTLTLFNIYAYSCSIGAVNSNGYSIFQFIYLYLAGAYFRMIQHPKRLPAVALYLSGAAVAYVVSQTFGAGYTAFAYNSPWGLAASAGVFMLFASFDFANTTVNRAARATLVVFLFHYIILKWLKTCDSAFAVVGAYIMVFAAAFVLDVIIARSFALLAAVWTKFYNFAKRLCKTHSH